MIERRSRPLPPLEYLRECFDLDAETGRLTWKTRPRRHFFTNASWRKSNTQYAGKRAGSVHGKDGGYKYQDVTIGGAKFKVHRIVHSFVTGRDEEGDIDHADGLSLNNSPSNLRPATYRQNSANRKMHKNNKSGFKGVHLYKRHNRRDVYRAQIMDDGKTYILGTYHTPEEAHEAYCWAAQMMHGDFARMQ